MTPEGTPAAAFAARAGWAARLQLEYEARGERTVLARRLHSGPLAVQRAFYPERDGTCHSYVLHPPGGIVGGDELRVEATLAERAQVVLTTPAATKFYRSAGPRACQRIQLRVGPGAQLEWLPQETIVYDGAELTNHTRVELAHGATFLGWEILCLGRPASGEQFTRGTVVQQLEVLRGGEPLVFERACYAGGGPELSATWGLGGRRVTGSLLCVTADDQPVDEATVTELRAALSEHAGTQAACSQLAGALVCRFVGEQVECALSTFRAAWGVLRRTCLGKAPVAPRIWST